MPFRAYEVLVQYLTSADTRSSVPAPSSAPRTTSADAGNERLTFPLGELLARCMKCDGTEFRRVESHLPLKMISLLECLACSAQVSHGTLLVELGKDAMARHKAGANARARRATAATANKQRARAEKPTDNGDWTSDRTESA